jgi:hypothetical protein
MDAVFAAFPPSPGSGQGGWLNACRPIPTRPAAVGPVGRQAICYLRNPAQGGRWDCWPRSSVRGRESLRAPITPGIVM